ncbi:MAG: non-canonical purine NTP pyrophosphatase [Nitrospinota bacterium]
MEENAAAKAHYYTSRSRLLTLAEDSGLEVAAVGGEPGDLLPSEKDLPGVGLEVPREQIN